MTSEVYNLMIAAISDYLSKPIELGKNASNFFNNGCYLFRLWSEDENFVWAIIVVPLCGSDNRYHAFFRLYKSEDAPEILETRLINEGLIDKSNVVIVLNADNTWEIEEVADFY